nr:hypothetical protein [Candidatus Anoxychlamydiales bacterium]
MTCLKILTADYVIGHLKEEIEDGNSSCIRKKLIKKIEDLKLPGNLQNYLIARSSPEPLYAAVELSVNDESFMRDFPEAAD